MGAKVNDKQFLAHLLEYERGFSRSINYCFDQPTFYSSLLPFIELLKRIFLKCSKKNDESSSIYLRLIRKLDENQTFIEALVPIVSLDYELMQYSQTEIAYSCLIVLVECLEVKKPKNFWNEMNFFWDFIDSQKKGNDFEFLQGEQPYFSVERIREITYKIIRNTKKSQNDLKVNLRNPVIQITNFTTTQIVMDMLKKSEILRQESVLVVKPDQEWFNLPG